MAITGTYANSRRYNDIDQGLAPNPAMQSAWQSTYSKLSPEQLRAKGGEGGTADPLAYQFYKMIQRRSGEDSWYEKIVPKEVRKIIPNEIEDAFKPGGVVSKVASLALPIVGSILPGIGGPIGLALGAELSANVPWLKEGWGESMEDLGNLTGIRELREKPELAAHVLAASALAYNFLSPNPQILGRGAMVWRGGAAPGAAGVGSMTGATGAGAGTIGSGIGSGISVGPLGAPAAAPAMAPATSLATTSPEFASAAAALEPTGDLFAATTAIDIPAATAPGAGAMELMTLPEVGTLAPQNFSELMMAQLMQNQAAQTTLMANAQKWALWAGLAGAGASMFAAYLQYKGQKEYLDSLAGSYAEAYPEPYYEEAMVTESDEDETENRPIEAGNLYGGQAGGRVTVR